MRIGFYLFISVIFLSVIFSVNSTPLPKLQVVAEDYYPLSYMDNGIPTGEMVDLIESISYSAGMPVQREEIRIIPWDQAYVTAQQIPGTLLLGIYRTPSRENQFSWIGPVMTDANIFFVKPGNQNRIANFRDVRNLKVGVIANDAHYELLQLYGFKPAQLITSSDAQALLLMLQSGEIDTFYYGDMAGHALAKKVFGSPDAIATGFYFGQCDIYFAMSKSTPDTVIKALQEELREK